MAFHSLLAIQIIVIFVLYNRSRERSEQSLVGWATPQLHDIDALSKMVDPAMDGMYPAKSLSRFADIIALCVQVHIIFFCPVYGLLPRSSLQLTMKTIH